MILSALIIIFGNLIVAYIISLYSYIFAVAWFFLVIGFQFWKWHKNQEKEEEFIIREELLRDEIEQELKDKYQFIVKE